MHPLDTAGFAARLVAGVLSAVFTWMAAVGSGRAVVRRLLPSAGDFLCAVYGAAFGYALLGLGVGALALLHWLSAPALLVLLLLMIAASLPYFWQGIRGLRLRFRERASEFTRLDPVHKGLCLSAALAFLVSVVAAALPAVWWDPLAYHLPIVALALHRGTMPFTPGLPQTGFPLLAEAAALPAYALAGSAGAAMVTLGAGVVLAFLCGSIANAIVRGSAILGTALIMTSALWLWLAPSFYVDVPFAMFAAAALSIPLLFGGDGGGVRPTLLGGLLAGAAAATKYPGLFVALLAAVSVLSMRRWQALVPFALGFALVAGGWYLRSWSLTGDPLYPFLTALFSHPNPAMMAHAASASVVQRWYAATPHYCGGGVSLHEALLLPWQLLTTPLQFCGDPGYALRLAMVLFIASAILIKAARPFAMLVLALTAFWFVSAQQWRFLIPALTLFAAASAAVVFTFQPRVRRALLLTLLLLSLTTTLANVVSTSSQLASNSIVPAIGYMRGAETAAQYLRRRLETYSAAEWLAQHAPGAKIFALDDVRDYYFGPDVAWGNSPYPGGWRVDWTSQSKTRYANIKKLGYRYMVVNANPAYTHRTETSTNWVELEHDERGGLLRRVFSKNDVVIYDLKGR